METIIPIKGKVKYKITLDPGVWIFDDRKVDLNTYFSEDQKSRDALEEYTKSISKHWIVKLWRVQSIHQPLKQK